VRCVEADIFSWDPKDRFDTVFFSFWLSHVPPNRFAEFWDLVSRCLAPGGRVFLLDSIHEVSSMAVDHSLPSSEATTLTRRLNDGREFQIYKVFYDQRKLEEELERLGWRFNLSRTPKYFLYGDGTCA
jgi:demethylmenaquinone methyltransferase/2-methoxy-6-polyprenyl-1,4-benzoquinol methylase